MTYNAGHKCPNIGKIILTQTLPPILHMRSLHVELMGHFLSLREHLIRETAYLFPTGLESETENDTTRTTPVCLITIEATSRGDQ